ncbi:putative exported protein [Arcticibacter svalbardensis MN12-7]|uniref:Putative exported protein n=1 Tax=Arcticibacter svalbardensis MN12-7 TaxID=1150600 RepID=R9GUL5_9SPHI|nr:DUF4142 domain-containing protein [Arcticibacter svalbardensis]EOR95383.1 putative exported protein [Arcticibacter svalbardensis MN12-7]
MKKLSSVLLFMALIVTSCSNNSSSTNQEGSDSTTQNSSLDRNDRSFLYKAANSSMMEFELSKMALAKSRNERIKSFSSMLMNDHTDAEEELRTIASQKGLALPTSLTAGSKKEVDKLQKKDGVQFDKDYIKVVLSSHRKAVRDFKEATKDTEDSDVKDFASRTLPILNMHLDSANAINKGVKTFVEPNNITEGMKTNPLK